MMPRGGWERPVEVVRLVESLYQWVNAKEMWIMPKTAVNPTTSGESKKTNKAKGKAAAKEEVQLAVVHPELAVEICTGDRALSAQRAKDVLGWEEETEAVKFGSDYLLRDEDGKKIRCFYNTKNRPLSETWARTLAQDILHRRWADSRNGEGNTTNGESVIVGRYGQVLSGQHRLIGLILAEQMRTGKQAKYYSDYWTGPVSIETVLVMGVAETSQVTRTLDNVKPRSLADVLFCDPAFFGKASPSDRERLCTILDYAVKNLWHRTGADKDAFRPKRTHSEALDFIERHPRVIRAVKHIWEEDQPAAIGDGENARKTRRVSRYVKPGLAAALLYLMGSARSDGDVYRNMANPSEKKLDWGLWEKASDFWALLGENPDFQEVRHALAALYGENGDGVVSDAEKVALLTKAWHLFRDGKAMVAEDLELTYSEPAEEDNPRILVENNLSVGGIDLGPLGDVGSDDDDDEATTATDDGAAEGEEEATEEPKAKRPARKPTASEPVSSPPPSVATSNGKPVTGTLDEQLEALRSQYPDTILLFNRGGSYAAWAGDAHNVAKLMKLTVKHFSGMAHVGVAGKRLTECLTKLVTAGYKVATCEQVNGATVVTPYRNGNGGNHE